MSSILMAVLSFAGFIVAYRLYGRFLGNKIFGIRDTKDVPACQFEDGVDHVPTRTSILFGHHFTTIGGAGPIRAGSQSDVEIPWPSAGDTGRIAQQCAALRLPDIVSGDR